MPVRNNNSVTERNWFFVIGTLPGSATTPVSSENNVFLFYVFVILSQRNSTQKKDILVSVNFQAHGVDFTWYWNWFTNWKQLLGFPLSPYLKFLNHILPLSGLCANLKAEVCPGPPPPVGLKTRQDPAQPLSSRSKYPFQDKKDFIGSTKIKSLNCLAKFLLRDTRMTENSNSILFQ